MRVNVLLPSFCPYQYQQNRHKDKNNRIIHFEEKSQNPDPKAYYASVIYFLTNEAVKKINQYIAEGNNPDQPGRLIQWLYTREETRGFLNENRIIDIGTPESLEKARKELQMKNLE